ncbi:MAG: hypothetical protein ACK4UN_19560, partial [Limisphaerales bacterium]
MKLIKDFWTTFKAVRSGEMTLGSIGAWLRGESGTIGVNLSNAYQQSVWVYAAVTAISRQLAQIPFRFSEGQRKGEIILESGELYDLFNRPHPQLSPSLAWAS